MSDEKPIDQQQQTKPKHAGGRPRKPVPPPPPQPNSLEETLSLGDQAVLAASPEAKLRWYRHRAEIVKDIQARADDERNDILLIDNKSLREKIEPLKKEKQEREKELATKGAQLNEARTDNEKLRREMKGLIDGHDKQLAELTEKRHAAVRRAEGLLAVIRYATSPMKELPEAERLEYAARLMDFTLAQLELAERLQKLVKNPEDHEKHYAPYRDRRPFTVDVQLNPRMSKVQREQDNLTITNQMRKDVEELRTARANIIPMDVMNEVFELLSVTPEQVRLHSTKWQERKSLVALPSEALKG